MVTQKIGEQTPILLSSKGRWKMKQKSRCTSWYNTKEFQHVGQCLQLATQLFNINSNKNEYDISPSLSRLYYKEKIQYGLNRVSIWKKRSSNSPNNHVNKSSTNSNSNYSSSCKIPHSIEIISSLAQTLLNDAQLYEDDDNHNKEDHNNNYQYSDHHNECIKMSHSSMSLRLAYASTIIRGVNGIADSISRNRAFLLSMNNNNNNNHNNNNLPSLSISNLCSKVGLPSWIVDIRHDSSHQELPSLPILRLGSISLLQFYIDHYWNVVLNEKNSLKSIGEDYIRKKYIDCYNDFLEVVSSNSGSGSGIDSSSKQSKEDDIATRSSSSCEFLDESTHNHNQDKKVVKTKKSSTLTSSSSSSSTTTTKSNYGAYSIFLDIDNEQKSKTKSKKIQKMQQQYLQQQKKKLKKITKVKKIQLQQHYETMIKKQILIVKEFVKNIPIDIGYDVLLSFLVWGDDDSNTTSSSSNGENRKSNDSNDKNNADVGVPINYCNGVLTSISYKQQQHQEAVTQSLHPQYNLTLLVPICKVWPGFITCLLVNLIDYIHVLEEESFTFKMNEHQQQLQLQLQEQHSNKQNNSEIVIKLLDQKLDNVLTWVQYLLSNELYDHLGWIQQQEDENDHQLLQDHDSKTMKSIKISTLSMNTNKHESSYTLITNKVQLPLNSLCDKCIDHCQTIKQQLQNQFNGKMITLLSESEVVKTTTDVISLLEDVLKEKRCFNHGLIGDSGENYNDEMMMNKIISKKRKIQSKSHCNSNNKHKNLVQDISICHGQDDETIKPKVLTKNAEGKNFDNCDMIEEIIIDQNTKNMNEPEMALMSLEEMENILKNSNSDMNEDKRNDGNEDTIKSNDKNNHVSVEEDDDYRSSIQEKDDTSCQNKEHSIQPWTLCNTWDACAIGTLPGYVS